MKFRNHTLLALGIAVACNAPLPSLMTISVGSVFPDRMDAFLSGGFERLFFKVHRGFSHWPWPYVAAFLVMTFWPGWILTLPGQMAMGFVAGAALHVLGDMFTPGGVPYKPWSIRQRFGFGFFKTGSIKEYLFTWGFLGLCMAVIVGRYILTGQLPDFHYEQTLQQISIWGKSIFQMAFK